MNLNLMKEIIRIEWRFSSFEWNNRMPFHSNGSFWITRFTIWSLITISINYSYRRLSCCCRCCCFFFCKCQSPPPAADSTLLFYGNFAIGFIYLLFFFFCFGTLRHLFHSRAVTINLFADFQYILYKFKQCQRSERIEK